MADLNLTNLAAILDSLKDGDNLPRYVFQYVRDEDADGNGGWYRFERDADNPDTNYHYVRDALHEAGENNLLEGDDIIIVDGATRDVNAGAGNDTYIITDFSGEGNNIRDSLGGGGNTIIVSPDLTVDYVGISTKNAAPTIWFLKDVKQALLDGTINDETGQPFTLEEALAEAEVDGRVANYVFFDQFRISGIDNFTFQIGASGTPMTAEEFVAAYPNGFSPVTDEGSDHTIDLLQNEAVTLTADDLSYGDLDGSTITYLVTTAPTDGTLSRDGVALSVDDSFTQADIDAGLITYQHTTLDTTDPNDTVIFTVSDESGTSLTNVTLAIVVTGFTIDQATSEIGETAPAGTLLSQFIGFDDDVHDVDDFSVTLTGGDGSDNTPFEMVVINGVLSLVLKADQAGVIDQDQADPVSSYDLTISYNGSLTFNHVVTITPVNDNLPTISFGDGSTDTRTVEVAEGSTDLGVTFIVEDADSDASAPVFYVRNNGSDFAADDSLFRVITNDDGTYSLALKAGEALDYETAGDITIPDGSGGTRTTKGYAVDVDIEVDNDVAPEPDENGNIIPLTAYIEVTNVNDVAPVLQGGDAVTLDARDEGTLITADEEIYQAVLTTRDSAANLTSYSLENDGDNDDALFEISSTGRVTFRANTTPDFETKSSYVFTVTATTTTDGQNPQSHSQIVTLHITDQDIENAVPVFNDPAFTRSEEAFDYNTDGSTDAINLGSVVATDADGDALTYEIVGTPTFNGVAVGADDFQIDEDTGEITYHGSGVARTDTGFIRAGDYDISVSVRATDTNNASADETFTIAVTVPNLDARFILSELDPDALPADFLLNSEEVTAFQTWNAVGLGLPITEGGSSAGSLLETIQEEHSLLDILRALVFDPQGEEITAFHILLTSNSDYTLVNADTDEALPAVFTLNEASKDTKIEIQHNGNSNGGLDGIVIHAYEEHNTTNGVPNFGAPNLASLTFRLPVTQVDDPLSFLFDATTATIAEGTYDADNPAALGITFTISDEDNDRSGLTSDDFIIYHLDDEGNIATIPGVDDEGNPIQVEHVATSFIVVPDGAGGYSLQVVGPLDYEAASSLSLAIAVNDGAGINGNPPSAPLTVTLTNINDVAPVFTSGDTATAIVEGTQVPASQIIYTAVATADTAATEVTYTLSGVNAGVFTIGAESGEVTFQNPRTPNFETQREYQFTVTATTRDADGNELTATQDVTLPITNVFDVDLAIISGSTVQLDENTTFGTNTTIYPARATHDGGATIEWSLSGDDVALFDIGRSSGVVTFAARTTPNFEDQSTYNIIVTATASGSDTSVVSQPVTISVNNLDEAPVFDIASLANLSLAWNADGRDTAVSLGTLAASDEDGDTLFFNLDSTPTIRIDGTSVAVDGFQVNATSGEVTYHGPGIAVNGDGILPQGDYNLSFNFSVLDGAETTRINHTVRFTVPDLPPRWILQELDPANLPDGFPVDATTLVGLQVADTITGLPIPEGGTTEGTAFEDLQADITLFDLLKAFVVDPQGQDITAFSFALVGDDFTITNADTDEVLGADFVLNAANQNTKIRIAHNGDDDGPANEALTIIAYDATQAPDGVPLTDDEGNVTADQTVTIDFDLPLQNVDDPMVLTVTTGTGTIDEGDYTTTSGDTGIRFTLTDVDSPLPELDADDFTIYYADDDGFVRYVPGILNGVETLVEDVATDFSVTSLGNGEFGVYATGNPDFEALGGEHSLIIAVTGVSGPSSEGQAISLTLNDVNDTPPVIDDLTTALQITENRTFSAGNLLTTLTGSADVAGATLTWSIEENVPADSGLSLALDPTTGALTIAADSRVDYEQYETLSFTVKLTATTVDGDVTRSEEVTRAFAIEVIDTNDVPPTINFPNVIAALAEGAFTAGHVIYTATAEAQGRDVEWSLSGGDFGLFSIGEDSGVISFAADTTLDFETRTSYELIITATTDDGVNDVSASQTVTVNVIDQNDQPPVIADPGTLSIIEEQDYLAGNLVTTLIGTADVADATLSWSIEENAPEGSGVSFAITDPASGAVTYATDSRVDHETHETISFTVKLTATREENGAQVSQEATRVITLNVRDINDAPPSITSGTTADAITEGQTYGDDDILYTVTAVADAPDESGFTLTYKLGTGGDSALFTIDETTGAVRFAADTIPNFSDVQSYSFDVIAVGNRAGSTIDSNVQTVTLAVTNANDVPVFVNRGLSIDEGFVGTVSLDARHLSATDGDQSDPALMLYVLLSSLPTGVTVSVGGVALTPGDGSNSSFTQADINAGLVSITFDDEFVTDSLSLTFTDGVFNNQSHTLNFDLTVRAATSEPDNAGTDGPLTITGTDGRDKITDSRGNDKITTLAGDDNITLGDANANPSYDDIDEIDYHVAIVSDGVAGIDGSDIISGFRRGIDEFHLNAIIKDHRHTDYDAVLTHIEGADSTTHSDNLILITPNVGYKSIAIGEQNTDIDDILSVEGVYLQFTTGSAYSFGRVSMPFMQIRFDEAMKWTDFTALVGDDYNGGSAVVTDFTHLEALLGQFSYESYFAATLSDEDDDGVDDGFTLADFGITAEDAATVGITLTGVTGLDTDDTLSLDGTDIDLGTGTVALTQAQIAQLQFQDGVVSGETTSFALHFTIDGVNDAVGDSPFVMQVDIA